MISMSICVVVKYILFGNVKASDLENRIVLNAKLYILVLQSEHQK